MEFRIIFFDYLGLIHFLNVVYLPEIIQISTTTTPSPQPLTTTTKTTTTGNNSTNVNKK